MSDAIVCAVPPGHAWTRRAAVERARFPATPMAVRDPSSNAGWTVDAVIARAGRQAASALAESPTLRAALSEARNRNAPVLVSPAHRRSDRLRAAGGDRALVPWSYVLVAPAYGEPSGEVRELINAIREYVRVWPR